MPWVFGFVTLFALVLVVLHFGTIEQFTRLALAATLLLRGLTFWLPMVPDLWLATREIALG